MSSFEKFRLHQKRGRRGPGWDFPTEWEPVFISTVEVLCWRLTVEEYLEEYMSMSAFAKMFGKAAVKGATSAATDVDLSTRYPNIALLLTALTDDQGRPRQTATLTVVCEQGLFKGGVKDRDHAMSLWRSGETMAGLLEALEGALESGTADWKVQTSGSRK